MFFRKYKRRLEKHERRIEELEKELERVKDRTKELGKENDQIERILKNSRIGEITYTTDWNPCTNVRSIRIYRDFCEYTFNKFNGSFWNCNVVFEQGDLANIVFCKIVNDTENKKKTMITYAFDLDSLTYCKINEESIE